MRLCVWLALATLFTGCVYGIEQNEAKNKDEVVTLLTEITHFTNLNSVIDISLSRESFTETCYVRAPDGEMEKSELLEVKGVTVRSKSVFVSCRITVGPMNDDLLGEWMLCGKNEDSEMRCQPVTIAWHNTRHPIANWESRSLPKFDHPVHFGGIINTAVVGSNNVLTCHVITPLGENLVIKADTKYPYITRIRLNNPLLCAAVFDIDSNMLGEWELYGRFRSGSVQNDVRLPMTFHLYNAANPYEQAYNVTTRAEEHIITLGGAYSEKVSGSGKLDDCMYISPSGDVVSLDSGTANERVRLKTFEDEVACELSIVPITEKEIGEWQFVVKFSDGNQFTEKLYIFELIEYATPAPELDGSEETNKEVEEELEDENITLLSPISHFTRQEVEIDISLNKESFEEECYIRPPGGELTKTDLLKLEGLEVQSKSTFVSCRVTIGPMTEKLLGEWRLCGKSIVNEKMRCQPVNITWNSNNGIANWDTHTRLRFNHPVNLGGAVNPGVYGAGEVTTCHVITPAGEDLVITTDLVYPHIEGAIDANRPLCSIVFKNITQEMLGDWVIYGRYRSIFAQNEVRFPITFHLYNKENPYEQAYNITTLEAQEHLVREGTDLKLQVSQTTGAVDDCIFKTPSGESLNLKNDQTQIQGVTFGSPDTGVACQISLSPISKELTGEWQIIGKFSNGILFDEIRRKFKVIQEDPLNPIEENLDRVVETMTEQNIVTDMQTVHRFVINTATFVENESCHLITPEGLQYAFITGFHVPGVEIINESGVECGVVLNLNNYSMIGRWTLVARAIRLSVPIERRLPFTIRVEENFVLQNDIDIGKGADLYLHLNDASVEAETCKLYGPDGEEYTKFEADPLFSTSCGYIIRRVDESHNGQWIIEHGSQIKKRGSVKVNVLGSQAVSIGNIRWTIDDSINIAVGPSDAVYCKIVDNRGHTLFDNFGQCRIVVNRVTDDLTGIWKMFVAMPGTVLLQEHGFYVDVRRAGQPVVTTAVERVAPSVMLTCSVFVNYEVQACQFRDPRGNILVAAHGVGQDGYMFNGSIVNYESSALSHDCTLRLSNPSALDLGIWRCAVSTTVGTYYGFLTLVCPVLMQDPLVAASVVTEPVLQTGGNVQNLEDEPVVMSCSIPTALRYCYFRSSNGSVFNVFPSMSTSGNFEYSGAGLDAGDCGIQFKSLSFRDSGNWSCHVGVANTSVAELRASFNVTVTAKLTVRHFWHRSRSNYAVEARVSRMDETSIEYCRFVRINGQGFTSLNLPAGYNYEQSGLDTCILFIRNPDIVDMHPWAVAVKLLGRDGELSATTTENLLEFIIRPNVYGEVLFWILILSMCLIPILAASALIPKKNREWTYRRASRIRTSFRHSWNNTFKKKPLPQQPQRA